MTSASSSAPRLPEWQVSHWLNTRAPITLASLRGRVVAIHAFQMLCPGCVSQGLPQAQRVRRAFAEADVAVIGLHTVFEHHAVTGVDALRAFVHEYGYDFPIGVDQPGASGSVPCTMAAYRLRGTPSLIVLDHEGRVRLHRFGHLDDLELGALLGRLVQVRSAALGGAPAAASPIGDEGGLR